MGMELIGRRLSADELRAVLDDPTTVDPLLYGDLDDDDAEVPEPELNLNKSWHALHYLLTGTAWEIGDGAGAAILGGEEIGEDGGYGPAHLLNAKTVRMVSTALDTLDIDTLRARFDVDAMMAADIYPGLWDRDVGDFDSAFAPAFADLCRFYRVAAAHGQAVLLAII